MSIVYIAQVIMAAGDSTKPGLWTLDSIMDSIFRLKFWFAGAVY